MVEGWQTYNALRVANQNTTEVMPDGGMAGGCDGGMAGGCDGFGDGFCDFGVRRMEGITP
jgi:hypothetical protein